jgi:uncharacterized protein (TIGR00375 family)
MKFIADFHIHSHYSMATSSQLTPEMLDLWGRKKGITVIGTGDAVHPGWLTELKEKLVACNNGLYSLKSQNIHPETSSINADSVKFILTAEISSIYKRNGKVRKVHNIIMAPSIDSMQKISKKLEKIGNISSDGRPILGLDSRNLLEIVLDVDSTACLIPAHIWTPWFSALGSKSGFDSIDECFDDLSEHIFAVETGLSSDPPMNWQCSMLDKYSLVSNSDAHSPENLGREANIFDTEISYNAIIKSLKKEDKKFLGTIEYFPEEGKYHFDGHRKCGICWAPDETMKHKGVCPVCGKAVTVGVFNRVAELSDSLSTRKNIEKKEFYSITPLKNVLSEEYEVGPQSKKITAIYDDLLKQLGSEFSILLDIPVCEIKKKDSKLAAGISNLRNKKVSLTPGYDGVFGSVKVFS